MRTTVRPSVRRRRTPARGPAAALLLLLVTSVLVVLPWGAATPASASASCQQAHILVNTGNSSDPRLLRYDPQGRSRADLPAAREYGDVAQTPSGELYGVGIEVGSDALYEIDLATGAELGRTTITGAPGEQFNALSALPDGSLLLGAAFDDRIWSLDPDTGATTVLATLPVGYTSAGDFLTLLDGDLLATVEGTQDALVRIHPDRTMVVVGTIPPSFGTLQSGDTVYLASSDGTVYEVLGVPTAASSAPIPVTPLVDTHRDLFGATAVGDAGVCADLHVSTSVDPARGTVVGSGGTATYTLTFDNSNGDAAAQVDQVLVLDDVLDDATVTAGPTVADGTGFTVTPQAGSSGRRFELVGLAGLHTTTTVTVTVRATPSGTGDHALVMHLVPYGAAVPATCATGSVLCAVNPVADLDLVESVQPATVTTRGQTVTWSYLVTNRGRAPVSGLQVARVPAGSPALAAAGTPGAAAATTTGCPVTTLPVGGSTTCTATSTTTQADVDAGSLTDASRATAVVQGTAVPVRSARADAQVTAPPGAALALTSSGQVRGQQVRWTCTVRNTGNVTLAEVSVVEDGDGTPSSATCPAGPLAPGARTTCTSTRPLPEDARAGGQVVGRAVASGLPPGTTSRVLSTPSAAVLVVPVPSPHVDGDPVVDPRTGPHGDLPTTGVDALSWTGTGVLLLLAGAVVTVLARRRGPRRAPRPAAGPETSLQDWLDVPPARWTSSAT